MGLVPLIFLVTVCQTRDDWIKVGLKAVPLTLIAIFGLATLALWTGAIGWDLKLPSHFILRIFANLFLTVIPEEAFFRGFLQRELSHQIGPKFFSKAAGILSSSLVFTLFHLNWGASPAILAFVFLASILYGSIYEMSKFLEGSILCHFAVNILHMLFFGYHAK
jgi:membrane protease YdiL (CAAX protease family)